MKKIAVFPNDPIIAYYNKGEIKERYFNPNNLFDEIHVISFSENEIEASKVQELAGEAKLVIHRVGKMTIFNKSKKKNQVLKLIKEIKPQVIRAYNPLLEGWVAAHCSTVLDVPFFVSLHVQYDGLREQAKKNNYKKYLGLRYLRKKIEPYTLTKANKITVVYKIIEPYVTDMIDRSPEILYNRVDILRFRDGKKILNYDKPLVLSVGRLTAQKNYDILIKAIKNLDVYFMIIGDGELRDQLVKLVSELGIKDKVIFKKAVPNKELQNYYKSADVFALAYDPKIEGLPIPVLEAMASGLPIVIPFPQPSMSDGLEDCVAFSDLNIESFSKAIKRILIDEKYAQNMMEKAQKKVMCFDGKNTEKREAEIYEELMSSKSVLTK